MTHLRNGQYTVKHGDTLSSISAKMYGRADLWPRIASYNNLPNGNLIVIGLKLKIPREETSPSSVRPLPTVPPTKFSASAVTSGDAARVANARARPVQFPPVKYNFKNMPEMVVDTPIYSLRVKITGEMGISERTNSVIEFELAKTPVITGRLKSEYDSKFIKAMSDVKAKFDPSSKRLELSCGYTVATKINGQEFVTYQFQQIGLNKLKFSIASKEVKGTTGSIEFKGNIGFEGELTLKNALPGGRQPVLQLSGEAGEWIIVGGLIVLGTAIIITDFGKDIITGGVGFIESPLSWAAASALFGRAAALAR